MAVQKALLQVETLTRGAGDRLESWKEIAAHLRRSVRTVKRWETDEGLPVHRHSHNKVASVYAYRSELEAWWTARQPQLPVQADSPLGETLHLALRRRVPCIAVASFLVLLIYVISRVMLR